MKSNLPEVKNEATQKKLKLKSTTLHFLYSQGITLNLGRIQILGAGHVQLKMKPLKCIHATGKWFGDRKIVGIVNRKCTLSIYILIHY